MDYINSKIYEFLYGNIYTMNKYKVIHQLKLAKINFLFYNHDWTKIGLFNMKYYTNHEWNPTIYFINPFIKTSKYYPYFKI